MRQPSPFRFFLALNVHATSGLVVLVLVAAVAVWTVLTSPSELDSGLGMVLVVQIFLASSGFLPAARRGHFDPILVGPSRTLVAVSHWLVSASPGAVAWIVIAGTAHALSGPSVLSGMGGRRVAALLIVSSLAWAAGFWFARGAAGLAWIAGLAAMLVRHVRLIPPGDVGSTAMVLRDAAALVVCPFLLLGPGPAIAPGAIGIAVACSVGCLIAVWDWASRVDVSLRNDP